MDSQAESAKSIPVAAPGVPPAALAPPRLAFALAVLGLSAAAVVAADWHGRSSRIHFAPPAELQGRRILSVADATEAFVVWGSEGVRGRRLVVLTGRWSKPTKPADHPGTLEEVERRRHLAGVELDADSALFAAANVGIARRIDVVMPLGPFARRAAEHGSRKEYRAERAAFRLPSEGVDRRFSTPAGFDPPTEPPLVLLEPSFFQEGVPADPIGWLASLGVTPDLVLIARSDPEATDTGKAAAALLAQAVGAVQVEAAP